MKKLLLLLALIPGVAFGDCAADLGITFTPAQRTKLCSVFGSAVTQSLIPSADNTYDLGSASKTWRTLYTGTSRIAKTSDILQVRQDANRLFTWDASSDTAFTMKFGDGGSTAAQVLTISGSQSDADDDGATYVCGGGACASDGNRGAEVSLFGNEHASAGGKLLLMAGLTGNNNNIYLIAPKSTGAVYLRAGDNDAARQLVYSTSSAAASSLKFGDAGVTAAQTFTISASTSDADDDSATNIGGGGAIGVTRGSGITVRGNEHTSGPDVVINGGQAAGGDIEIVTNNAGNSVKLYSDNATLALTLGASQAATFTGTVTSTATGALGWTPVAGANTACNTTCTSACVFGIDSAAPQTWLTCADATADMCLCAGAS